MLKLKFRYTVVLAFLLISCSFVLCSCQDSLSIKKSFKITDLAGREVSCPKDVQRVIAINPIDTEVATALGCQDKLIGRGTFCNNSEYVNSLEDYGTGGNANIEAIANARPDLILMSKAGHTAAQVAALENAGVTVLLNDINSFEDMYSYIQLMGKVYDCESAADNFTLQLKSNIDDIHNLAASKQNNENRVYFEISIPAYGSWTAGSNTFLNDVAQALCLQNCYSDQEGYFEINEESVVENNPDIIVCPTYEGRTQEMYSNEIYNRAGWNDVSAIKNRKCVFIEQDNILHAGPRLITGMQEIYHQVYE